MDNKSQVKTINPLLFAVKKIIGKLRQNPDVYPIRYYKKSSRFRRNWQQQQQVK